jgi:hypothetical protein
VARGDSDAESDVDLVVIQSPSSIAREYFPDFLRADIPKWTGNRAQVFDTTPNDVRQMWQAKDPLIDIWLTEGRHVCGIELESHLAGGG